MISPRMFFFLMLALLGTSYGASNCNRTAVDFKQCVVNAINDQMIVVKKGIPELKIGPLDPLLITKISMKQGQGPVSIDLELTDQMLRGIKNYKIESASVDLKNYKMEFTLSLPYLNIEGRSKVEGKILAAPLRGNGYGWSNYTTVHGKAVLTGHPKIKNDNEYFTLDKVKFDLTVKKGIMHMNDLFNGNKELGEAMNKFMADNWEVVFQELRPVVEQTIEAIVKDIASKILNHYSLDDLFPQ